MLLPLGVKILWFALSLSGLAGCWVVSLALGRTIGSLWAPIVYCVGCSVLEGIFCLGMVWKMDPYAMPGRFCIAQSVSIALGTFIMTSIVCTFSYMTNQIVLKPKTWANCKHRAFSWRRIYVLPTVVFPAAALALHVALVVKLRAVQPATEFYCDSSSPQWVRFLSYAGTPLLLSLPSLFLSIKTVLRVSATNRHIQRARTSEIDMDPPHSSSYYSSGDSYNGDTYTKPLRPKKKFSLKRTFSSRRSKVSSNTASKIKEKSSFDSDDIDTQLKSHTTDSSPAASLRFTTAPTPRSSRAKEDIATTTATATTTLTGSATVTAHGGPGPQGAVVKSPAAVHFHIPIKPPGGPTTPPSACRDTSASGGESRTSSGSGPRPGCVSPCSVLSSDSEAASASSSSSGASSSSSGASSPPLHPASGTPPPLILDSNATIAEVNREPSSLSLDSKSPAYPPLPPSKDDSWRSVMELTNGSEEIKARRIEWHVNTHGSDSKGIVEHCTTEEELEEYDEDYEDGMMKDDDTLSEELTAGSRALPKIRTHTKHFTNYILPGGPTRSKRPPPPYLSSTIWRIIVFQITFVLVQILGSLSTLIDVARQSTPTPLGTHHFAMLFVAWGPVFFFGSLSHIRQNITLRRFWKRAKS